MPTRRRNAPKRILACALALLAAGTARAQIPQPRIPDLPKRSGMVSRYVPIQPHLPGDPRRDEWYDTRWGDPPNLREHPNFYKNGGIYGLPWRVNHSRSVYPYFYGAPGENTIPEGFRPPGVFWRPGSALLHPWKPVGMYYDQGSYVPVYDLDPVVPGPGPMLWPFFRRITSAGG